MIVFVLLVCLIVGIIYVIIATTDKELAVLTLFVCAVVWLGGFISGHLDTNDTIKQTILNDKPYNIFYTSDDDGNEYMMSIKLDHVEKIKVEK